MEDIQVGSLVEFLDDFRSETIPNIGIVLAVISFDDLLKYQKELMYQYLLLHSGL